MRSMNIIAIFLYLSQYHYFFLFYQDWNKISSPKEIKVLLKIILKEYNIWTILFNWSYHIFQTPVPLLLNSWQKLPQMPQFSFF